MQVYIQETEEWAQGDGRGNRRKKILTQEERDRKAALEELNEEDGPSFPLRERVCAYVECFQGVLQARPAALPRAATRSRPVNGRSIAEG